MRIFFGLSLPEATRRAVESLSRGAQTLIPGRYALSGSHHLTLAFLGDVPQARLTEAQDVLTHCASAFPAPRIAVSGADFFGSAQNAILILRAESQPDLTALHRSLVSALGRAALPVSCGPFAPHITLARHAQISSAALLRLAEEAKRVPAFRAPCAHLFLSARDEANILRYTPLFHADFLP